jgi:bile acid:Na+ symporter, BASS family
MNLQQIIMLALQVSILSIVFGLGLKASAADLLYVVRRPRLLARSLLAVFLIMPVVAVALVWTFDFERPVKVALVSLALSPIPPLLPRKETKAGGDRSFGLGLMALVALLSIVAVPAALEILQRIIGRELAMAPRAVAGVVMKAALVPLVAGVAVRAALPAIAERVGNAVTLAGNVLLTLALVALLANTFSLIWAATAPWTVLALTLFTAAGLGIGHVLGGPNPNHSTVLALSTACRHPAIAFSIASANFPDQRFGALILLYLIVNTIVVVPYVAWQSRRAEPRSKSTIR